MADYAKILDHPTLLRDMNSKAILQTDLVAVRRHEKRINALQQDAARDKAIADLQSEMKEIKNLLLQLSGVIKQS